MNNEAIQAEMRRIARQLLADGAVTRVIGWEAGTLWYQASPVAITAAEEADKLIWNDYCQPNLSKYLLDFRYETGKIALFVKGCDARAFNRLLQDQQVKRESAYLIGIPCPGMKDHRAAACHETETADIPLAKICQSCRYPNPIVYDELIGEAVTPRAQESDYSAVKAIEDMDSEERYAFWQKEHSKCLHCYACRNVCPACNCRKCIFEQSDSGWSSKDSTTAENQFYALTRAMHVAGRCIECGQCEYACPSEIPIMLINQKLAQDIDTLFGQYDAGLDVDAPTPLGHFAKDDPEEFM